MSQVTAETHPARNLTSVMVTRPTHNKLADMRHHMSRDASRRVTMEEVITLLIDSWETH